MDLHEAITIKFFYEDISPVKNGTVTLGDCSMDFVIHKGRLILSDPCAKEECYQAVYEALKALTVNAFKVTEQ